MWDLIRFSAFSDIRIDHKVAFWVKNCQIKKESSIWGSSRSTDPRWRPESFKPRIDSSHAVCPSGFFWFFHFWNCRRTTTHKRSTCAVRRWVLVTVVVNKVFLSMWISSLCGSDRARHPALPVRLVGNALPAAEAGGGGAVAAASCWAVLPWLRGLHLSVVRLCFTPSGCVSFIIPDCIFISDDGTSWLFLHYVYYWNNFSSRLRRTGSIRAKTARSYK